MSGPLDALTGTGTYATEIGGVAAAPSAFVEATIATTPSALDEEVMVLVGAEGSQLQAGPCRWEPRPVDGGLALPTRGDSCLVVTGDKGHRAIVWWKPTTVPVLPFLGAPLVASLPGAPVDGQEINLLIDQAGTYGGPYVWPLRYRAAATTSKWEVLGSTPALRSYASGSATTISTSYTVIDGTAPSIAVPLAGDYDIAFGAQFQSAANDAAALTPKLGTVAASDSESIFVAGGVTALNINSYRTVRATALAAAAAVTLHHRSGSGGTAGFIRRELRITPVRVG